MKLQKIEIRNFRGFPGPELYSFELNSKNLILYGENGSGKSTLFHAISEFFDINHQARPFREQCNRFANDVGGQIAVYFDDGQSPALWNALNDRPMNDARVSQTAIRTACLDYRAILRTSFLHTGSEVNLFELIINYLLANYTVTVTGGTTRTIAALWQNLEKNIPKKNHPNYVKRIDELCDEYNQILEKELKRLEQEAERLLTYFSDCNTVLHITPEEIIYDPDSHNLINRKILIKVDFNHAYIEGHQHFLNEARLSAIAIALYLASAKLSVPPDLPNGPESLKLLVLDDIVIGLDLSNRLPLLDILSKEFPEWQKILMTYDRVWFDMVRMRNPDWVCQEIYTTPSLIPVHKSKGDYLQKACEHLVNNDDQAAAVYTRAEFERRLKKCCEKLRVKLPYKQPPNGPDSGEMLDGLENHLKADPKWFSDTDWQALYPMMFLRLRTVRKVILNPLSHSELITLARGEVQQAIDAVDQFKLLS
jgi:hypothetical protein